MTKSKLPKSKLARRRFLRKARRWGRSVEDMAIVQQRTTVGKYTREER